MTGLTDQQRRDLAALNQTRWWEKAACAGTPFALFDSVKENLGRNRTVDTARVAKARAICAGCPVVTECRTDADILPDPSFRAGYTAAERNAQNRTKR